VNRSVNNCVNRRVRDGPLEEEVEWPISVHSEDQHHELQVSFDTLPGDWLEYGLMESAAPARH
jgi:hypothetical protein